MCLLGWEGEKERADTTMSSGAVHQGLPPREVSCKFVYQKKKSIYGQISKVALSNFTIKKTKLLKKHGGLAGIDTHTNTLTE